MLNRCKNLVTELHDHARCLLQKRENQEKGSMEEGLLCSSSSDDGVSRRNCSATTTVIFSALVAACGSLAFGLTGGYSSPAESGIMSDIGLSIAQYSVFSSILKLGGMLGALISGKVADFFGRRVAMWILEMFFILGWILIILGKNALYLDIGRLSMGIGSGLHCYVAPIYIAEIAPKDIRGRFIATISFVVTCGFSFMFFVGNFISWRTLAVVGVLPSVAHVVGLFFIPESPRWIAKIGNEKGSKTALKRLRGNNADILSEADEIKECTKTIHQEPKLTFWDLFDRRYAQPLLVGVGLVLLVQLGGSDGISAYSNAIFEAAGCPAGFASTFLAAIQLPSAFLSVLLMDKAGRRPLLMVTAAISCFGCFLIGLGFFFQALGMLDEISPVLTLSGILINASSFAAGMCGTPWVIMSEIFPMKMKATGGTLVTLSNWLSSSIVTYAFNFLFEWSSSGVFFLFSFNCALIVLFVAYLVPETKGRTLEEIQASMGQQTEGGTNDERNSCSDPLVIDV